ncbi:ImmA/IrrE family metallo-endopeptidase [Ureibacillus sp. Re31]|uniref:ImmA/IrrE family metallo-endopeptidase n=1 Tax=Ureibacillus galli TaxID=2762222 RepID=A0ABR8XAW1_9BACL|nr:ImmA/IrrE family metallo-endopeptidase [Ureibacillus galli]MBD8026463.1 ImmA/IrrE family metallo-endopeptidase [Ureibacillus galli]
MYTMSHTEDFIKDLYLRIGILKPQQLNYHKIANGLGVKLFYWDDSSQALFLKDLACIFLNRNLTQQELWQDFCHELAHVLFHWGNQRRMSESFRQYQETKANQFMYHACVPSFMLNELNIFDATYESVRSVCKLFNVEYEFALKRIRQFIQKKRFMQNLDTKSFQHM